MSADLPGAGRADGGEETPEARTLPAAYVRREKAWVELVRYLVDEGGMAPPYGARGLWVDLYDQAMEGDDG